MIFGTIPHLTSAEATLRIRSAVSAGRLATREVVLAEGQRLDQLAGQFYGDGRYWWVIAAASGIGWPNQVPPGTRLLVPVDISAALGLV
jgi:nucleoid-associated protein YgaU